ncbi:MAG: hypothetical protein JWP10_1619 [Nocardioidaceae bacterium]|nr:hypothetical protein [Nocardioidaceae bacterium]
MTDPDASDFVFTFSYETYNDAVRREMMRPPDRILAGLMASPKVRKLLVANPYRSVASSVARRVLNTEAAFPTSTTQSLHSPLRLKRTDSVEPAATIRDFRRYDRSLRRASRHAGLHVPAVITTNPLTAAFSPFAWAGPVTYFGRDDWLSTGAREDYWPAFKAAYEQISYSETAVVAVSQPIIDRIQPRGPYAVVPNGVEPNEWLPKSVEPPAWFAALPAPRAVYVGTIDTRLDVEGLENLARRKPEYTVVLLGPVPDPSYLDRLTALPNIYVHPAVGRAELVATLRHAEVSLVAHVRTRLTEAMSPLKVFEYLAAGSPVLSVDLPPIRDLGPRVTLVPSVADFADVIDDCLAMGRTPEPERQLFIEENSWASRHRTIMRIATRSVVPH